jgi:diguanylate cyclase (GGDEF)-like protein/PAS domain S-box-containing protein
MALVANRPLMTNRPEHPQAGGLLGDESLDRAFDLQRQRFWLSHARLGIFTMVLESLFVLAYAATMRGGSHRGWIIAIGAMSLIGALLSLGHIDHVSRHHWRRTFSLIAALAVVVALTMCIVSDGGLDSPLVLMISLPIVSSALALPPRQMAICSGAVLAAVALVGLTDVHMTSPTSAIAALCAFLVGVVVLSLGATFNRERLEKDDQTVFQELQHYASTDDLTGCLNHGAFYTRLNAEVDRALRHNQSMCLLVIDVDLFKSYNDRRGHAAGDEALAGIGRIIRETSRSSDIVGRVGGDEFAVGLPNASLGDAMRRAERIVDSVGRCPRGISVSIGFAALDPREPTATRLFRDADQGLYRAKADGRGRTRSVSDPPVVRLDGDGRAGRSHLDPIPAQADWDRLQQLLRQSRDARAEASSIVDSLESTPSVGFAYVDRDYRLVRINAMLAAVNGLPVADQLGRKVSDVIPKLWPQLRAAYEFVVETGDAVVNHEVFGGTAADPGRVHWWLTNLSPVSVEGHVVGIAVVVIDITDRKELEQAQAAMTRAVVGALSASVALRDPYTAGHQERVSRIAGAIADEIGVDAPGKAAIELAAKIHDIGKLSIPPEILARSGRLTEAEMNLVREHSRAGYELLRSVDFPDPSVAQMVFQHHERLDGSGYPNGLRDGEIMLGSRIIAVADVVESMAARRPYRDALGVQCALDEIHRGSGSIYDPQIVDACTKLIRSGGITFE